MNTVLFVHELRQGFRSLLWWTLAIVGFIVMCIALFPQMASQMDSVGEIFSSMGSFSEAFGMDKINFGSFIGFYSVECGNILGLGGALFAAILGAGIISKEESGHTVEFLYTHPLSRCSVLASKLAAVFVQIVLLNLVVFAATLLSITAIGESIPWKEIGLINLSFFLCQIEIAGICFCISAFLNRSSLGVGIAVPLLFYYMNIAANIGDKVEFLKYITPYAYCEASEIVSRLTLDPTLLLIGLAITVAGTAAAFVYYPSKDLKP